MSDSQYNNYEEVTIEPEFISENGELYSINTNIPGIAEQVFSVPPAPAYSYGLELESDTTKGSSAEQSRTVFEILMTLTLKGMRIKYGENTDPRRLSPTQIETLQEYMRSFGWDFKIMSTPCDDEEESEEHRAKYTPDQVEWYRLRLPDPENNLNHDIVFAIHHLPHLSSHQSGASLY